MQVGDVISLAHEPFIGVFYKVVEIDIVTGILLEAYSDRSCTRRYSWADGRLIPPKETV